MDTEDLQRIRETMAQVLGKASGGTLIQELYDNGWVALLAEERPLAVAGLFEAQGRGLRVSPALDLVILDSLGLASPNRAVIYPTPTGNRQTAGAEQAIEGVALSGLARAGQVLIPVQRDKQSVLLLVEPSQLNATSCDGLDADLSYSHVSGSVDSAELASTDADAWSNAMAFGRLALASELLGLAEEMLAVGVRHVSEREQFGRPIGAFQTVKHRLADCYVEMTASRLAIDEAWKAPSTFCAAAAKAQAGQTAVMTATHVQQVCGAMGWTWEYQLHRYIRRTYALDALLGTTSALQEELGAALLATGSVPRIGSFTEVN